MPARKGFAPLIIILGIAVIAIAGAGAAALVGKAPVCPNQAGAARGEKELGELLDKTRSVTTTDGEATTIAQNYVAGKAQDTRVCFTAGSAHTSGNIKLGPFTPSFYASAGVDLSGSTPKATSLAIQVGSLPDIPVLSSQVESFVAGLINENLAKVQMKKKYSVQFSNGSATVTKLSD